MFPSLLNIMNKLVFKLQIPIAFGICSALAAPAHADVTASFGYYDIAISGYTYYKATVTGYYSVTNTNNATASVSVNSEVRDSSPPYPMGNGSQTTSVPANTPNHSDQVGPYESYTLYSNEQYHVRSFIYDDATHKMICNASSPPFTP